MTGRVLAVAVVLAASVASCAAYDHARYLRLLGDGGAGVDAPTEPDVPPNPPTDAPAADVRVPDGGCGAGQSVCAGACVDTQTDPVNCGGCAHNCLLASHVADSVCVAGACRPACVGGYADCASEQINGCETDLATTSNCGACGVACASPQICGTAADGGHACSATCSGTMCGSACTDTTSDPLNCGRCGQVCTTSDPHARATCSISACASVCAAGYHACGGRCASDTDPATCGASCTPCAPPAHATATCMAGECRFSCNSGYVPSGSSCLPRCGDRALDSGETCDDGGSVAGDGCGASCQLESPVATSCSTPATVPHIVLDRGVQVYAIDLNLGFAPIPTLCVPIGRGGFYLMDVRATGTLTITLASPAGVDGVIETRPSCAGVSPTCTNAAGVGGTETQTIPVTAGGQFAFIPITVNSATGVVTATFDLM